MSAYNLYDEVALAAQARRQKKYGWDLEKDIDWSLGIDVARPFLPLDVDAIAFPKATEEQRLALSHLLGLIINSTISEMESVIHKLKDTAWAEPLRRYPVNPEMWELGELFFQEESKHSMAFRKYNDLFCEKMGIDKKDLDLLMPKAFGSLFLKTIQANARDGGAAFWWLVASVEEVSIELYRDLHRFRDGVDPLYSLLHRRHLEEESRHRNYAFLMLDIVENGKSSFRKLFHRKTDLLVAQFFSALWVMAELHKVFEAEKLKDRHPFFRTVASTLPLLRTLPPWDIVRRLFVSAPYISTVLNTRHHKHTLKTARHQGALVFPFPKPRPAVTTVPPRERSLKKKRA